MICSLKSVFRLPELKENRVLSSKTEGVLGFCSSLSFSTPCIAKLRACSVSSTDFMGKPIVLPDENFLGYCSKKTFNNASINAQATICVSKALRWWSKTLKPNMVEIHSAQELVYSLLNAGDALVVVDFYSPGCGGCKALHPKICQLAELYPNALFLQVNYEELKTMCHGLHIHVLPFFRFYRGADGQVCSFSCTNATIKKFKDALTKHGNERYILGPAKGLDESELETLASIGEIKVSSPFLYPNEGKMEDLVLKSHDISGIWSKESNSRAAGDFCKI